MSRDVSIVFKASDNLSNSVKQMQRNVTGLSRDVSEYRKIQDQAFGKKAEVKLDIEKAKKELKELSKAIKDGADGLDETFKEKQLAVERLSEEYRRLTQAAREAGKAEKSLQDDISRSSNAYATRGGGTSSLQGGLTGDTGMLKTLAGAGLANMLGGSISNSLNATFTSTYGSMTGNAIGEIFGGAATGAAMGSIAGAPGAAIGAAIGGLTGAINAMTAKQENSDDFARTEVKSLYDNVMQDRQQSLASGIELASTREQNVKALSTLLGSDEAGKTMFEDIKQYGIETPYEANSLLNSAKQMLAYGIDPENIMSDTKMLGDVAMGDQNKFNSLSYVYAQTQSAGKLNGQDLRQYTEAGFNPLKVLAEEAGTSLEAMRDKMSAGAISAEDVTRAFQIATSEGGQFYGAASKQMETYAGKLSMINDIQAEINVGYGEGYNEERMKGMDSEMEQLNGVIGEQMAEANKLIGQFEADLENQYQQSIIDATTSAMETGEYKKALEEQDGAEMGRIIAAARAEAEINYKNGEEYQLKLQAEQGLVQSIQNDLVASGDYVKFGETMAEQFSLGWSGLVKNAISSSVATGQYTKELANDLTSKHGSLLQKFGLGIFNVTDDNYKKTGSKNGNATGLPRVPYDGYYKLHEGEKVKTKVESNQEKPINTSINITVNNNSGNPYEITNEICRQLIEASENYVSVG